MKNDKLGDRMKSYEKMGASLDKMMPHLPVISRLDGKAFHSFTKGLERPYDKRLSDLMVATTKFLVQQTNACIGYTQSDEITLIWYANSLSSQIYFDGRRDKMNSVLAAQCSVYFNEALADHIPEKYMWNGMDDTVNLPVFDCRTWCVPTKTEACNVLVWREQDATRNSVQMAGQSKFSHKQLQGLSCNQIQEKLWQEHNINWNDYPAFFKRGTYIQRRTVKRPFSADEMQVLPAGHEAHKNPGLIVKRRYFDAVDMPIFASITNREAVVFDGEEPETELES